MIKLDDIELHDALLKSTSVDYVAKKVMLSIEFYLKADSDRNRQRASVIFEEVESISQISDLDSMQKNASAGTISYWKPSQGSVTYIYLVDGCIAIKAQKLRFETEVP